MEMLQSIMQVWAAVAKDYGVMEELLPRRSHLFRMYADILGQMSMDLNERQEKLAEAEAMEYAEAESLQKKAQDALNL